MCSVASPAHSRGCSNVVESIDHANIYLKLKYRDTENQVKRSLRLDVLWRANAYGRYKIVLLILETICWRSSLHSHMFASGSGGVCDPVPLRERDSTVLNFRMKILEEVSSRYVFLKKLT